MLMLADRLCLQRREQVGQQVPLPVKCLGSRLQSFTSLGMLESDADAWLRTDLPVEHVCMPRRACRGSECNWTEPHGGQKR